jgi:hypothetical protein
VRLELRGAAKVQKLLADQDWFLQPTKDALGRAVAEGEQVARARAGTLARSLQSEVRSTGATVRGLSAEVRSTHPAASYVEAGRKPGGRMPPVRALERWGQQHGIVSTYAVSRAIAQRGLRGRFFMRSAKSRIRTRWRQYLKSAESEIKARWDAS